MRNAGDLYPTPPCAAFSWRDWMDRHHPAELRRDAFVDPTAGFGQLLEWGGIGFDRRRALELSKLEMHRTELIRRIPRGHLVVGVDALEHAWPEAHITANFPFGTLQQFVERSIREHLAARAPIVSLLTPIGFWHAQRRAVLRRPDWILALGWRPNFAAGYRPDGRDASGPNQDYCWAIYDRPRAQEPHARWARLERPKVPPELRIEHARFARLACEVA